MSETTEWQTVHDGDKEVDILLNRSDGILTILPLAIYTGERLKRLLGQEYSGEDSAIRAALETNTARKNLEPDETLAIKRRTSKTRRRQLHYQIDNNRKLCDRFNSQIEMSQNDRPAYLQEIIRSMKQSEVADAPMQQILQELNESCNVRARPNQVFQALKSALSRLAIRDPQEAEPVLKRLGFAKLSQFPLIFHDSDKNETQMAFQKLMLLASDLDSGVSSDSNGFNYDDTNHLLKKAELDNEIAEVDRMIKELKSVPPRTAIMPVIQLREMEVLETPSDDFDSILAEFATQVRKILKLGDLPEHLFSFELGILVANRFKRQIIKILGRKMKARQVVTQEVSTVPEARVVEPHDLKVSNAFRFEADAGYVDASGQPIPEPSWEERASTRPEPELDGVSVRENLGFGSTNRFEPDVGYVDASGQPIPEPGWEERASTRPVPAFDGVSLREKLGFGTTKVDPKAYDPDKT